MRSIIASWILFSGVVSAPASAQGVILITEYFDYGPLRISMNGLNGGTGWGGPWGLFSDYFPANQPSPCVAYYQYAQNAASQGNITTGASPGSTRSFAQPLSGVVWMSFIGGLVAFGGDPDVAIALNNSNLSAIGIGSVRNVGIHAWASGPGGPTERGAPESQCAGNLVVAKIELNADGTPNERYNVWLNPTITEPTEAGLGTPDIIDYDAGDIGPTWNSIAVLLNFNEGIDAIRIAANPSLSSDAKLAAVLGGPLYPGTGGDLELRIGVNGAPPTMIPDQVPVMVGDSMDLLTISPAGSHDGDPLVLFATPIINSVPNGVFGLYMNTLTFYLIPYSQYFWFPLASGGTNVQVTIPPSAPSGSEVILQALVIDQLAPLTVVSTNGQEVQIQ